MRRRPRHRPDRGLLARQRAGTLASGLLIADPLKIRYKPVTHAENFCATGSEAIRNAAYAVASGAYDVVMAIGNVDFEMLD